ncbi:Bcl-2 family protein, partial [Salmonella sp. s51933]|uniref:Bcl-2 family protein n=1 Tax=Salmonella sp. s51933 TaxID=3160127 RepID=UPI0037544848
QDIAKEMFADHIINWGRIAVLYTFAGQMAIYCERNNMKAESANVPDWLSTFVNKNLSSWIEKTGGWDALNEYFQEKKDGNDMWWGNVLCTVGLVAGAAGAALVFAR